MISKHSKVTDSFVNNLCERKILNLHLLCAMGIEALSEFPPYFDVSEEQMVVEGRGRQLVVRY